MFLSAEEKELLSIKRMIFHVVGKDESTLNLLSEISPPVYPEFFIERVRSVLQGNLFSFLEDSETEKAIRAIDEDHSQFEGFSKVLAKKFQGFHNKTTSRGAFFLFQISIGNDGFIYALIKYDNEEVVRYFLEGPEDSQVPRLEMFRESFVRKAESLQKIAIVRFFSDGPAQIVVRDRSKPTHISEYFEKFLGVRRINSPADLSRKLFDALKKTLRQHKSELSPEIRKGGVGRLYDFMTQGIEFDPENIDPILSAVFGATATDSPIRRTLSKTLRDFGAGEFFKIDASGIEKPKRRRIETAEGVQITFDEEHRPKIIDLEDGRKEIRITTSKVIDDDIDIENQQRNQ